MRIPGVPRTVLLAPDSFKGTFTAREVAAAAARGVQRAGLPTDLCPVADGGEGTLDALRPAIGGEIVAVSVSDPLGRPVEAGFLLGADGVAVVETAAASGLHLVAEPQRDPLAASTYGTGELIAAAAAAGARVIWLGVGGSATTDGGAGALRAIEEAGGLGDARLVVLCDVRTPFEEAARVFSPQKGAGDDATRALSRRLLALARRLPRDPIGIPMTGAAGGLSGGLWAALRADLVAGAAFVLDRVSFDVRMRAARAVIAGEGLLDRQSLSGKALAEVATRSRQSGVPCHAIVGRRELEDFDLRLLDLQAVAEAGTLEAIEAAARTITERHLVPEATAR